MSVRVEHEGIATSWVDAGTPGRAALGFPRGGACDLDALRLANRLVGNPPDAAGFETSGGLVVHVDRPVMVCVTGAIADLAVEGGPPLGWGSPVAMPAGARLRVGRLRRGLRVYLAIRGDEMSLSGGVAAVPGERPHALRVWPGPRAGWFTDEAWRRLLGEEWTVSAHTDRVGARLRGPVLERAEDGELPSEGMVEGALQVPTDGQPIVMLADHPTTGGYPVIAVIDPAHLTHAAQLAPGDTLRFTMRR